MGKIVFGIILNFTLLYSANIYETIFDGNCGSCHTTKDNSSAPLITKIVKTYRIKYPQKNDFVEKLSKWVFSPNEKNALFKDAIKRYGLMPELNIDKETLYGIAKFLYSKY